MQYQIFAGGYRVAEPDGLGAYQKNSYLLELWSGSSMPERESALMNELSVKNLLKRRVLDDIGNPNWGSLYDVERQDKDGSVDQEFRFDDKTSSGRGIAKAKKHSFNVNK